MAKIGDVGLAKTMISDYFSWETAVGTCESPHMHGSQRRHVYDRAPFFRSVRQRWQQPTILQRDRYKQSAVCTALTPDV